MQKISLVLLTTLLVAACGQATQPINQESQNEIAEPIEVAQEEEPIESANQVTQESTPVNNRVSRTNTSKRNKHARYVRTHRSHHIIFIAKYIIIKKTN